MIQMHLLHRLVIHTKNRTLNQDTLFCSYINSQLYFHFKSNLKYDYEKRVKSFLNDAGENHPTDITKTLSAAATN